MNTSNTYFSGRFANVSSLIFLDFDGVTHPVAASPNEEEFLSGKCHPDLFCRSELIARLLDEFPGAAMVAISAWRLACLPSGAKEIDEARFVRTLRPLMPSFLFARMIGITPFSLRWKGRHDEIMQFVGKHKLEHLPRVILDDHAMYYEGIQPAENECTVICNPEEGLTMSEVSEIRDFFQRRQATGGNSGQSDK